MKKNNPFDAIQYKEGAALWDHFGENGKTEKLILISK
jgi:hypothetical protein